MFRICLVIKSLIIRMNLITHIHRNKFRIVIEYRIIDNPINKIINLPLIKWDPISPI